MKFQKGNFNHSKISQVLSEPPEGNQNTHKACFLSHFVLTRSDLLNHFELCVPEFVQLWTPPIHLDISSIFEQLPFPETVLSFSSFCRISKCFMPFWVLSKWWSIFVQFLFTTKCAGPMHLLYRLKTPVFILPIIFPLLSKTLKRTHSRLLLLKSSNGFRSICEHLEKNKNISDSCSRLWESVGNSATAVWCGFSLFLCLLFLLWEVL